MHSSMIHAYLNLQHWIWASDYETIPGKPKKSLSPKQSCTSDSHRRLEQKPFHFWRLCLPSFPLWLFVMQIQCTWPANEMRFGSSSLINLSKHLYADFRFVKTKTGATPRPSFSATMSTVSTQNDVVSGQSESIQKTQQPLQVCHGPNLCLISWRTVNGRGLNGIGFWGFQLSGNLHMAKRLHFQFYFFIFYSLDEMPQVCRNSQVFL